MRLQKNNHKIMRRAEWNLTPMFLTKTVWKSRSSAVTNKGFQEEKCFLTE